MSSTLDRAYRVEEPEGVERYRIVVFGTTDGGCRYPGAASRGGVLGITTHSQPNANRAVTVRRSGIALAEAESAITKGDPVVVAGDNGRIKSAPRASLTLGNAVANTAIDFASRIPGLAGNLIRIAFADGVPNQSLGFTVGGSLVTIELATDGTGLPTTTASQLIDALNANPVVSSFLTASNGAGSDGSGTVESTSATALSGGEGGDNIVGFAQEAATSANDIIEVYIAP